MKKSRIKLWYENMPDELRKEIDKIKDRHERKRMIRDTLPIEINIKGEFKKIVKIMIPKTRVLTDKDMQELKKLSNENNRDQSSPEAKDDQSGSLEAKEVRK